MSIKVDVRAQAVIAMLKGFRSKFREALWRKLERISLRVQSSVKDEKLSGQMLHVKTGTLRRSINRRVEDYGDGIRAVIGTNIEYAPPHEFGFDGVVQVRAHVREAVIRGRSVTQNVRGHPRNVHLPERSFLRSTLEQYRAEVQSELRAAAIEVLKK